MSVQSPNFGFLSKHDELLVKFAARAERYVFDDPNAALSKLRQFNETLVALTAAHVGVEVGPRAKCADTLAALERRGVYDQRIRGLFHELRMVGNRALHEGLDDQRVALRMLQVARLLAVWFHRSFGGERGFKAGPFVPPPRPRDEARADAQMRAELEYLQEKLAASRQVVEAALESKQEAVRRRIEAEQEAAKAYHDSAAAIALATETEETLESERERLLGEIEALRAQVAAAPVEQAATVARSLAVAEEIELDETATRVVIDAQLREAGWDADSVHLRYAAGVRPQKGRNVAIAEWPTASGPADYVLFRGLTPLAIVEAKRATTNVAGAVEQAERYAASFEAAEGVRLAGSWGRTSVPFAFASNGRGYLRQISHLSGVHFRDLRDPSSVSRPLCGWYTPDDLASELAKPLGPPTRRDVDAQFAATLRPYQREAVRAVESAIDGGRRELLLAMATGTGKTRTAICLAYRLIQSQKFRRVLLLVDRTSLGEQTEDAFNTLHVDRHRTFTEIYDTKGLEDATPGESTRLHIATVQGMVRRVLMRGDAEPAVPVSRYDCVIIDECHRGYNLDRELSDAELTFRDEGDYISKYRRVVEYFDAVRIGLTATPALHTREIFGAPVYQYGYRQAVLDGHLRDHEPPTRIVTKLARDGIRWEAGSEVPVIVPSTGQADLFETPDELEFDVAEFNRSVLTEHFNRAVCEELARKIDPRRAGKTMVFCATDAHADLVVTELLKAFQAEYGASEIRADMVKKITGASDRPLELIRRYKNETLPNVAVTVELLTTGIDVPQICNLVFLRRVRSRILYEQMIGRATRKCDEIGKEFFRIYDAVDLYAALQDYTDMKPVVVNPKVTFSQLSEELRGLSAQAEQGADELNDAALALVRDQLAAKLQRKARAFDDPGVASDFAALSGGATFDEVTELVREGRLDALVALLSAHPDLVAWLDRLRTGERPPLFISDHLDEVVDVTTGYGDGKRPEEYLASFRAYIDAHSNELPALTAVTQRPRALTRAELHELRLKLDQAGFGERALRAAYRDTTNQDVAASIIGYVRRAALGDPLVDYEERVKHALGELLRGHQWTPLQRQWLERIGKQLLRELVVDRAALDSGVFRAEGGGFDRLNKVFDGRLESVLGELADAVWIDEEVGA